MGDIRAALVLLVKEALGDDFMRQQRALRAAGVGRLENAAQLELLGSLTADRLPVFSFRVRNGRGGFVHQQLVTRMLSDRFGIQAGRLRLRRAYVHRLLDIGEAQSLLRRAILDGREIESPDSSD